MTENTTFCLAFYAIEQTTTQKYNFRWTMMEKFANIKRKGENVHRDYQRKNFTCRGAHSELLL